MEPYWSYTYSNVDGLGSQKIDLYKYSAKCIALKTSQQFGRAFSKHLKSIGGKFNMNLKFDDIPSPGWIFKIENQEDLQNFISKVQKKEVTPRNIDDKTEKQENITIFRRIKEIVDLIPDESDEYILSEANGYRTYMTFGLDTPTEEGCVYSIKSSKKKVDIYQIKI